MSNLIALISWWTLWFFIGYIPVPYRVYSACLLSSIFIISCIFAIYGFINSWYPHRIIQEDSLMRVGPDVSYGISGSLQKNDEVVVYSFSDGWYKVRKSIVTGWVPISSLSKE